MRSKFLQLSFLDRLLPRKRPPAGPPGRRRRDTKPQSSWASTPELHALGCAIRQEYFPDRPDLDEYTVYWSRRNQKRTLASCNLEDKRVSVARELNNERCRAWLSPLLYHEMCHAYLGYNVSKRGNKRAWHGPEFRALEGRHPQMKAFDEWIKSGGWDTAVRSHRARAAHARRKANEQSIR